MKDSSLIALLWAAFLVNVWVLGDSLYRLAISSDVFINSVFCFVSMFMIYILIHGLADLYGWGLNGSN